jgi:hypothetical protein
MLVGVEPTSPVSYRARGGGLLPEIQQITMVLVYIM